MNNRMNIDSKHLIKTNLNIDKLNVELSKDEDLKENKKLPYKNQILKDCKEEL